MASAWPSSGIIWTRLRCGAQIERLCISGTRSRKPHCHLNLGQRHASTSTRPASRTAFRSTRAKNAALGTAIGAFLVFGYLYVSKVLLLIRLAHSSDHRLNGVYSYKLAVSPSSNADMRYCLGHRHKSRQVLESAYTLIYLQDKL